MTAPTRGGPTGQQVRAAYARMMLRCEPFPDGHGLRFGGAVNGRGYGVVRVGPIVMYAHRLAFLARTGQSPPQVNHRCDRPLCVDEGCLFAGSALVNNLDAIAKGRARRRPLYGAAAPNAKLRPAQVRAIRRRAARGILQQVLADEYGVSNQTISNVVRGVRYASVA